MINARSKLFSFIAVVCNLFLNLELLSQNNNSVKQLNAKDEITNEVNDSNFVHVWLDGDLTPKGAKGSREELTFIFFEENIKRFKIQNPRKELKVLSVQKDELSMTHIRFTQLHKDVGIYGTELIAHFDSTDKLVVVNGDYVQGINISVSPTITQEVAEKKMIDDLNANFLNVVLERESKNLLIYPFENRWYLTWHFVVHFQKPTGWWEYFIDASNGNLVYKADRMRH